VLATVAWKMFLDRPLLGCGFEQYKKFDVKYLRDPRSSLPLEKARPYFQHKVFLGLLTETGLLGAGVFVALMVYWFRDAWALWRRQKAEQRQLGIVCLALGITYITNGMLHDPTVIPMVHMLLFALAGMCRGLVASESSSGRADSRRQPRIDRMGTPAYARE
jgi:O-antigen ligase